MALHQWGNGTSDTGSGTSCRWTRPLLTPHKASIPCAGRGARMHRHYDHLCLAPEIACGLRTALARIWSAVLTHLKRRGAAVPGAGEPFDRGNEGTDSLEAAPAERLTGEDAEPRLDLVQPRGRAWREVEVHALVTTEPALDLGCLVGGHIVEDDVDLAARVGSGDEVEEVEELDGPVLSRGRGRDRAGGDLEGRRQDERAVASRDPLDAP